MQVQFSAAEIAAITQPSSSRGETRETIRGLAALGDAKAGDLSFLGNARYKTQVAASQASLLLLPKDFGGEPLPNQLWLLVDNPSVALARVCARIEQSLWPKPAAGIHPSAVVASDARVDPLATVGPLCIVESGVVIGARTHLQAQVFIGRGAKIGDNCWCMPGVVVATECILGNRVRLQPGVIIGSDGFGYEFTQGRHVKIPQVGQVVIGDDVEIGANTCVDRGKFGPTVIGAGTKIDNLVQVAHNVTIGRACLIAGGVGIAGSTSIGDGVIIGGQAGLKDNIEIGAGARIAAMSAIMSDVAPKATMVGAPAVGHIEFFRRIAALKKLTNR